MKVLDAPDRPAPDAAPVPPAPPPAAPTDWWSALGPVAEGQRGSMALGQGVASALEALRMNKLRAFLTALGIIIGVGAVIVMVSLGAGASASIQQRLTGLGTNLLTISPGSANAGGVRAGGGSLQTLKPADVQAIQAQVPGIAALTPILQGGNVQVVAGNQNWSTTVQAGHPAMLDIQDWSLASGAAFDDADEANAALVCDIGQTAATNLFGTADPVGQRIMVRNVPLVVKGLLASKGSSGFRDQDDVILMPFSTAQVRLFGQTSVNSISVQVEDATQMTTVQTAIEDLLRARHHLQGSQPDDFRIQNNQQILQTVESTTRTLTFLLAGVAAVSLVVGGIGIMNIMLGSVTERTREIGIRLAVGAKEGNILTQFLIESVILSVVGGLVGILLGVLASDVLSRLGGWTTLVTPSAILISFGFAALVGIFFGYYPARRASRLDPIQALHYE